MEGGFPDLFGRTPRFSKGLTRETIMIEIFEKETSTLLGSISETQLQFLKDHLEEESIHDKDYHINRTTVDYLESEGADPELVGVLRRALMTRDEIDFYWK
jgi:hypothetical protein